MFLLNGERRQCIDIADRGFQYGDGVFETIEVLNGKPLFLDRHLKRLEIGCHRLLIPIPDVTLLAQEALQLSATTQRAVLKLTVTRGSGGRGYQQPPQIHPTRLLSLYPFPDYPLHYQSNGVALRFCQQRLAINPSLAGIKHMNRLEQILARAEWRNDVIQEGLMLDYQEHVIEGTMSNVFLVKDGGIFTPKLSQCGVAGIVRELVLEFSRQHKLSCQEAELDKQVFLWADEVFITNSIIGIWPVNRLDVFSFNVGPVTRLLQKLFNSRRLAEDAQ